MLLTIVACLLIAGAAIIGLGVLLLPFYAWAWWRDEATLREARDAGLLEYRATNATRQEPDRNLTACLAWRTPRGPWRVWRRMKRKGKNKKAPQRGAFCICIAGGNGVRRNRIFEGFQLSTIVALTKRHTREKRQKHISKRLQKSTL